jgi:DNA polymerase III subunit delta
MIYVVYGLENYLINNELNNIITKYNIDKININNYDLDNDLLDKVIEDASMMSMFSDKKLIVCSNSLIFTGTNNEIEQNTEVLNEYLDHINEDTIIVFIVNNDKLDERKKIVKKIKEKATIKYASVTNINNTVKDMLKDYKINDNDIKLLIDRVGTSLDLLNNEINKLKMYKYEDKVIVKEDILELTTLNYDLDYFKFIDDIVNKNKRHALEIYHELLKLNEEPIKIIVTLANQFRLMYQVKVLLRQYNEAEISKRLEIHPYRVKLAREKGRNYSEKLLKEYLYKLSDLDINIKTGKINKELGLEIFIMEV